jgi:hypothetical protein
MTVRIEGVRGSNPLSSTNAGPESGACGVFLDFAVRRVQQIGQHSEIDVSARAPASSERAAHSGAWFPWHPVGPNRRVAGREPI